MTAGKPLGNGFPLAVVATTKEIASCLGEFASSVSVEFSVDACIPF